MFSLVVMLIVSLVLAVFAVQNTATVQLQFLIWHTQNFSIAVLVVLSAGIGAFLMFCMSIPTHHRKHKQLRQREKELSELRDAIGRH
jgi:uncharacterized integral membrane protein